MVSVDGCYFKLTVFATMLSSLVPGIAAARQPAPQSRSRPASKKASLRFETEKTRLDPWLSDFSPLDSFCTGKRRSRDVIIYLGQKQHSSYDATHANTLNASMASLRENYGGVGEADVIVWHEGDLTRDDANALDGGAANVRFCLLTNATGWALPPWIHPEELPEMTWSLGYRKMIRFYAVTVWHTLHRLGYEWMMRMDDDSFFLSRVDYSIFDSMRANKRLYAYRMLSAECPRVFSDFVREFVLRDVDTSDAAMLRDYRTVMTESGIDVRFVDICTNLPRHCRAPQKRERLRNEILKLDLNNNPEMVAFAVARGMPYCAALGQYGYYNNWFVTNINWWRKHERASAIIRAFDATGLIFTHRSNDLIFQTAVLKLYMPPENRYRHIDFSYQHHTMRHNQVQYGGIESGTDDKDYRSRLQAYADKYGGTISPCDVRDTKDGPASRIYFVNPGPTSTAPSCGLDGTMPFI